MDCKEEDEMKRPPTIVNQPPTNLFPPDNTPPLESTSELGRIVDATRQRLHLTIKLYTLHKLSEFEPYTSSPIDRNDEPLFDRTIADGQVEPQWPPKTGHLWPPQNRPLTERDSGH
jgi:hypothetical protein